MDKKILKRIDKLRDKICCLEDLITDIEMDIDVIEKLSTPKEEIPVISLQE